MALSRQTRSPYGWIDAEASPEVRVCVLSADGNSAYVEVANGTAQPEEVLLEWSARDSRWTVLTAGQVGLVWTRNQEESSKADGHERGIGTLRCALFVEGDTDMATIRFAGDEYRAPVRDGYCLLIVDDVAEELSYEWPVVAATSH